MSLLSWQWAHSQCSLLHPHQPLGEQQGASLLGLHLLGVPSASGYCAPHRTPVSHISEIEIMPRNVHSVTKRKKTLKFYTWLHTTIISVTPRAVIFTTKQGTSTFRVVITVTVSFITKPFSALTAAFLIAFCLPDEVWPGFACKIVSWKRFCWIYSLNHSLGQRII